MGTSETSVFAPDYSQDFHCIADRCRHSCCIGWEIDIDDVSLERYRQVPGRLGKKLRRCIYDPETGNDPEAVAHFILSKDERCPFLNEKNLCELILSLGEDAICDICTEHPRFYNTLTTRTEMGFGLCCEEAARMLLTWKTPIRLVETGTMSSEEEITEADFDELEILAIREKIFRILQDRTKDLRTRFDEIRDLVELPEQAVLPDLSFWSETLAELERLDPAWNDEIERLKDTVLDEAVLQAFEAFMCEAGRMTEYENLLWYLLYRHLLEAKDDGDIRAQVIWAVLAVKIIGALGAWRYKENGDFTLEDQIDLVRMFSSEIEYSDENVECLIEAIRDREYIL
ncbi:MAG: flagellin lysine-N-methylase [Clostridiales bacterium]|nr:flagellin lysine-N-methylase [Clostridiales bacterium]